MLKKATSMLKKASEPKKARTKRCRRWRGRQNRRRLAVKKPRLLKKAARMLKKASEPKTARADEGAKFRPNRPEPA